MKYTECRSSGFLLYQIAFSFLLKLNCQDQNEIGHRCNLHFCLLIATNIKLSHLPFLSITGFPRCLNLFISWCFLWPKYAVNIDLLIRGEKYVFFITSTRDAFCQSDQVVINIVGFFNNKLNVEKYFCVINYPPKRIRVWVARCFASLNQSRVHHRVCDCDCIQVQNLVWVQNVAYRESWLSFFRGATVSSCGHHASWVLYLHRGTPGMSWVTLDWNLVPTPLAYVHA